MFCPRCSQEQVSEETKFCSRCGFSLSLVAEVLTNGGFLPVFSVWENKLGKTLKASQNLKVMANFFVSNESVSIE